MLFRAPFFAPLLYPQLVWRMPADEKAIYLTFDDGPTPGPTDFVLSTLAAHNAKATFFCVGENVVKHAAVFERVAAQHSVGNHTYRHLEGWHHPNEVYLDDVRKCQEAMGGTALFRPPYGKIKRKQIKMLSAFKIIMWDVLSFDFLRLWRPERCLKNSIRATRPGSIVVFHDSYRADAYVRFMLPRYLAHFKEKGFVFKKIPDQRTRSLSVNK